ncbi:hypothetical protein FDZ74_05750 [bacterium]|nr:MAG: hypothetical protein FDZ74_05750 [bacterium]
MSADVSAEVTWRIENDWTLDKAVDIASWDLMAGQSGVSTYAITATKIFHSEAKKVYVQVNVGNGYAVTAENVVVVLTAVHASSGTSQSATLNFGNIPSGSSVYGTADLYFYMALNPGDTFNVTAVVTSSSVSGVTATASATAPDPEVPAASLVVNDTNGTSHTFTGTGTWSYPKTFTCNADEGSHTNTASATYYRSGVAKPLSDSVTVTVNCTDYGLTVTKTANTSFDRTFHWNVAKSSSISSLTLSAGQFYTVPYSVTASVTGFTDSNFAVAGNISVTNPAPFAQSIASVSDVISGGINASVNCGVSFPYSLAAGGTLTCSYSAPLPDTADRTNTATAALVGGGSYDGSAAVSFAAAAKNEIDECIDLSDSLFGNLGTVCASQAPKTFNYSVQVGGYGTCGHYTVNNTATFTTNDTGSTGSASWVVDITVPCGSCSLTPGYWKTHSSYGPAPYDDTWAQIGENTAFYLSGKSWYGVLWTAPQGNAYYILAHAYIAARLNQYNGADVSVISVQLAAAENFFQTYTPTSTLSKTLRQQVVAWAAVIDNYNNGLIGPGHCTE